MDKREIQKKGTRDYIKAVAFLGAWIICLSPSLVFAFSVDTDQDGLLDEDEVLYYTDPTNPDTDGDGYLDGVEVQHDYSPHIGEKKRLHEFDYDGDGLNDWLERWFGADIGRGDSDNDGQSDYEEVMRGQDPKGTERTFSRHIEVDRTNQRLYYFVDKVKIHNYPVSTGNPYTPTPAGMFEVERLVENKRYVGDDYDYPGVKWNIQFKPSYYLHTAYWHNDFGKRTRSHGCVNMREQDAAEIYKYVDIGLPVHVIGETPRNYWVR